MRWHLSLLLLSAMLGASTTFSNGQAKHPGDQKDCSSKDAICTEWESPATVVGASGFESWHEERSRDGKFSADNHQVMVGSNTPHWRWASTHVSTRSAPDGETNQTSRSLEFRVVKTNYIETCSKIETPKGTSDTHQLDQYVGTSHTAGFYVRWSHGLDGDHIMRKRWENGNFVDDAAITDATRCNDKTFPWTQLRDPNLKPPTGW
ncbi:MAG: hypothetical protein ACRENA_11800 [Vulcanimicrobiaceae bacterium]